MPNYPARYYHKAHSSATTYSYEGEEICMDELLDDKEVLRDLIKHQFQIYGFNPVCLRCFLSFNLENY